MKKKSVAKEIVNSKKKKKRKKAEDTIENFITEKLTGIKNSMDGPEAEWRGQKKNIV